MRRLLKNTKPTLPNIYPTKRKVFVGLSGGVDSAVSAALLKQATPNNYEELFGRPAPEGFRGYDVTGVFIKAWQPDWLPCSWREERRDAMKVALALEIPFVFIDAEKEYKEAVVDAMLAEYKANRTPNPDVICNREIKFGIFWEKAKALGADFIATGHYAQVAGTAASENLRMFPSESMARFSSSQLPALKEGRDAEKDQSYFLWTLTQEDLAHTLFPVGHLEKAEVRKLAEKYKLPVAEKKDSQGVCFMGEVSMEDFLSHFIEAKPGNVLNTLGEVIGTHKGLIYYTIGERRGFEVWKKGESSGPFYVVAKEVKKNTLVVSDQEQEIVELSPRKIVLKHASWLSAPEQPEITARIRYRGEKLPCVLTLEGKKLAVEFATPVRGLSLGQSIVFYSGDTCLGGAVMDKIIS